MPIARQVQLIDITEFAGLALDKVFELFVMNIAALKTFSVITIYLACITKLLYHKRKLSLLYQIRQGIHQDPY